MKFLSLVICTVTAFTVIISIGDAARCSKNNTKYRTISLPESWKSNNAVFYFVAYAIIQEMTSQEKFNIRNCILREELDQPVEMYSLNYNNLSFLNFRKAPRFCYLRYYFDEIVAIEGSKLQKEKCLTNSTEMDFYVATADIPKNEEVGIALFYACKMWTEESSQNTLIVKVRRSVVLLYQRNSEHTDFEDAYEILMQNHAMTYINYSFLDGTGFCICEDALNYVNDCPHKNYGENVFFMAILAFSLLATAMIIVWSNNTSIEEDNEEVESDQIQPVQLILPDIVQVRPRREAWT